MTITLPEYRRLCRALDDAASARDRWAAQIADDAIAGRPLDQTLASLYTDATSAVKDADHAISEYLSEN